MSVEKIRKNLYRAGVIAVARYRGDRLSLQATSLTYTTLLSLVPFLAVTFSVLKALGVQNAIEPSLAGLLEPLGPSAAEITGRIVEFVNNIRVGILGGIGVAFLFYTVVSLIAKIEDALNQIWRLPRSRPWGQRVTAYLSVVLVGPVMVFTAFALTASAQSHWLVTWVTQFEPVRELFTFATRIMPFVLLWGAFTFLYKLLPNTKVPFGSALIGGATAALLWQIGGSIFAAFVAGSGRYDAIYSSFAVMIVFLIWLYVGWLVVLVGAEVAYFHHHPRAFVRESLSGSRGHLFQEWVALAALTEVARRQISGQAPWTAAELAAYLGVSSLSNLIDRLVSAGILLKCSDPPGVALARLPEHVSVKEILDIVNDVDFSELEGDGPAAELLMRRDQLIQKATDGVTLKTLAAGSQEPLRFPQTRRA
ncbi:MAG TPA: YihY/virulence factor BrkB family protein [Candidatus Acidoferrales bacterium]|nr:YihY/virulence factor BrkB family protein [Candidatus Acidoferrales bacterium]